MSANRRDSSPAKGCWNLAHGQGWPSLRAYQIYSLPWEILRFAQNDKPVRTVGVGGLACRLGRCFCILPYAEVSTGDPHLDDPPKPVKRGLSPFYGVNLFYALILLLIIPQIRKKAKKKPSAFVQNPLKSAEAARPLQRVYKLRRFSEKSFRKLWKS